MSVAHHLKTTSCSGMQLYLGEFRAKPTNTCGDSLRKNMQLGKEVEVE